MLHGGEPSAAACDRAREQLVAAAAGVFNGELIEAIDSIRRDKEQTIDHDGLDTVLRAEWEGENGGDKLVHGSGGISQPRAE